MQLVLIQASLCLALALGILIAIIYRGKKVVFGKRHAALSRPGRTLRLLKRAASINAEQASCQQLQQSLRMLYAHLWQLQQLVRQAPRLPADNGEPRLMSLACEAADAAQFSPDRLTELLKSIPVTPAEAMLFPQCVALAQCSRLNAALRDMLHDAAQLTLAQKLLKAARAGKPPAHLLASRKLTASGMAALISLLRKEGDEALGEAIEAHLVQQDVTPQALSAYAAARSLRQSEELRRTVDCFEQLWVLDWLPYAEMADSLHPLLMKDPAGDYPRLTPDSRYALRLQAERLARRTHLSPAEIVRQALIQCASAEDSTSENSIIHCLQDPHGLTALQKALPCRRGRIHARLSMRRDALSYAFLLAGGIAAGFLFLQSGAPVFMLPFFSWTAGCIPRFLLRQLPPPHQPAMMLPDDLSNLRTLVILPALLRDPHEAIQQVRRMKAMRHALPGKGADLLLLGDFTDHMTAVSSGDAAVMHAALSAVAALNDPGCFYIQRARVWDGEVHLWRAAGGRRGAVEDVCRLIAQGECAALIACATVELRQFDRHYAYVLVLPEDARPAPGLLERLLGAMLHPLCSRYPVPGGWRGCSVLSPEGHVLFDGSGLIRPDAYLEAVDGMIAPSHTDDALCGELAGHASVAGALLQAPPPDESFDGQYQRDNLAWQSAGWQLPWVQTPEGFVRNPLGFLARFRLRERLRRSLTPLAQCLLMLWAVLTGNLPLLLLAVIAPAIGDFPRHWREAPAFVSRLALLPTRAVTGVCAMVNSLRRRRAFPAWAALEVWTQGIAATMLTALALALPQAGVPALILGVMFACFPLAHQYAENIPCSSAGLTEQHLQLLEELAHRTWQFFDDRILPENGFLPPRSVQFMPETGPEAFTTPEAIGGCLLACLCAKELGLISADEASARMENIAASLRRLPKPFGLFCRRYTLPALTVLDAQSDAAGNGFLIAALLTCAQALRTWLPELSPVYRDLSGALDTAANVDVHSLYDPQSGLFHHLLDENGQGQGHVRCFADIALLLSVTASARGLVPPAHFDRLSQACIRLHGEELLLSQCGTAEENLLAGLFLPIDPRRASAFAAAMHRQGQHGLWGQGASRRYRFDMALHCRRGVFGVPQAALSAASDDAVYAPYAAALALPFLPREANDALLAFREAGALGLHGMCDAVDCTKEQALAGVHDTFHQAIMLMSTAHVLADAPVQRYFCALPEIEATLPLLFSKPGMVVPHLPYRAAAAADAAPAQALQPVDPLLEPPGLHLLGTHAFRMTVDARSETAAFDDGLPLMKGLQFYLADEGRVYRIGDPRLPGQTVFAPGEVRIERLCGSLKAELICWVDTLRRRALHMLTITNLSTQDRIIDAADMLWPDLNVAAAVVAPQRPRKELLALRIRSSGQTLYHSMSSSVPTLSVTACTDAEAFLGRCRTLHHPASLEEPMQDHVAPSLLPCMSFRTKLAINSRGAAILWFSTSLQTQDAPRFSELTGLRRLAAAQHQAIDAAEPLPPPLQQAAYLLAAHSVHEGTLQILLREAPSPVFSTDLAAALDWLNLHGLVWKLRIVCSTGDVDAVFSAQPKDAQSQLILADAPDPALFTLRDDQPLLSQLTALTRLQPPPDASSRQPRAGQMPDTPLRCSSTYGGFDPASGHYIITLEPGMTTPAPWPNVHANRHYRETVDECGLHEPFHEQVFVHLPDGAVLSPWSAGLPRRIRMEPAATIWEAWSEGMSIRLSAACLPEQPCGLRVLKLRNATDAQLPLQITVTAALASNGQMLHPPISGTIMTSTADGSAAFIAGDGWDARRISPHPLAEPDLPPPPDAADDATGGTGLLCRSLTLPPLASAKVMWVVGRARHAEVVGRALSALRSNSAPTLLNAAKAPWARRLNVLTVSTPEETFDLLMNTILPLQALQAEGAQGAPALMYIAPRDARRMLLRAFRQRSDNAGLTGLLRDYVLVTQDDSLMDAQLPEHSRPLYDQLRESLLATSFTDAGLPEADDPELACLQLAADAQALLTLRPDDGLQSLHRRLHHTADARLWADGCFGAPLRLPMQTLSCEAFGSSPRTRQALRTAWTTLYDRPHGLLRSQEPTDTAILPGLAENGGMRTSDAVAALHALLTTGMTDEAHELLRALNPLHHTDEPHRMETFRQAPYRLHGGMWAAPMEAGRGIPEGGNEAAARLYAIILRDVLGFHRSGSVVRMKPCVPPDWESFTLTLHEGASAWHISMERRLDAPTLDGEPLQIPEFTLSDDGHVHHIRLPL